MSTVKSLKVTYNPINERNTFTNGDLISGQVTVEVDRDIQISSLFIKFRAKADVLWSERHGNHTVVYHAKERYFNSKHYFIHDKNIGVDNQTLLRNQHGEIYSSVVAPGCHVYPFTFQIPMGNFPSSFRGPVGKIVYQLEAKLSRSMRIAKKDLADIYFVSRSDTNFVHLVMIPQHESKTKKMKVFSSGSVSMDVNIEKTGFIQGEGMKVMAMVQNNSSREIKLKYRVYIKQSFFANCRRKLYTKDLLKEVGEPIPPSSKETVTRVITIPRDMEPSILNCNIIKVEYRLRVYLDVKYASDPEIKFPIIILPACQAPFAAPAPPGPTDFGFEPFGNPNPPVWGTVAPGPPGSPGPPVWGTVAPAPPGPPVWGAVTPAPSGPPVWGTVPPAPPVFGAVPPQVPPVPQASNAPPPYEEHAMYPSLPDHSDHKTLL
ncbi:arrestin domain-containing protein 3-like [Betta splendens]|uniref:Arrestin domain-containing protein 3-like n=1 Tax=Betta splendens TaxID=158456 RepID=A0A9W2Y0Y2_BETSP|nr:arrestin domain-containing protein 3-like [Betta splendens]